MTSRDSKGRFTKTPPIATLPRARDARGRFLSPKVPPKAPPKKPANVAPKKPAKPAKAPPKKPAKAPPKKPAKAPPKKPAKAPPKKPAKVAPKKPAKVAPKKPAKPAKVAPKKPAKVAPKKPAKPAKAPPKKPAKAPPKKPAKVAPKKPAKVAPKKPAKVAPKKPAKAPPKKPAKAPPKKPAKAPPKKPAKATPKKPAKVAPKKPSPPDLALPEESVPPSSPKRPSEPPPGLSTEERRKQFYHQFEEEERKALERRSKLTPAQAKEKIARVLAKVQEHYFYQGYRTTEAVVLNSDKTVDGEVLVTTREEMFEADDQLLAFRKLIHQIPHVVKSLHPDLWFSVRVEFQSPEIVDDNGDPAEGSLVFDVVSSNLLDPAYVLSENRWRTMVHQVAWQHTHPRLYGNIQGACLLAEAVLTKFAQYRPTITFFTFKMGWNVHNVSPPKLR